MTKLLLILSLLFCLLISSCTMYAVIPFDRNMTYEEARYYHEMREYEIYSWFIPEIFIGPPPYPYAYHHISPPPPPPHIYYNRPPLFIPPPIYFNRSPRYKPSPRNYIPQPRKYHPNNAKQVQKSHSKHPKGKE